MTDNARLVMGAWEELGAHARAVRTEVFIREQSIPDSLEWDEHDEPAAHCVAFVGAQAVATGRLLADGRIGRMAVLAAQRRAGLGGRLLERLIDAARERGDHSVMLSAQTYVLEFYRRHGFVAEGEVYQEAGIAHQDMRRPLWGGEVEVSSWFEAATPGGVRLHQQQWRPARGHGGGVYLLHGLGEHIGRYESLARWWCARGWIVRAHDHAGHGRSEGARGVITRDDEPSADASTLLKTFADSLGRQPLLLGHSMGGAMAADLVMARRVPVAGLVLSSPALAIRLSTPMRWLAGLLNRIAPGKALGNGLDPRFLSHDTAVVSAYQTDPLVHDRICARLLTWIDRAGQGARAAAQDLPVQTLLLVAGEDRLVDPLGSREFASAAPSALITLHWYDSLYHELFNEITGSRQRVLDDLDRWLRARYPDPAPA